MPAPAKPHANGRPRRRGTKAETRERLIGATLDLLHSGGETAVTTVSVTRAAAVVQSVFYQHFANVAEVLATSAERAANYIREAVASARSEMYRSGPGTGKDLEQFYRLVFALAFEQRPIVELFLRYRTDPLALNGVMARLARDLRVDLTHDLAEQSARAGLSHLSLTWIEAVADNLIGASLSAIEARLEGRGPDVEESARLLAAFTTGACLGVIEASGTA